MDVRLRHRRECGCGTAVDVYLSRPLLPDELLNLADGCQGLYRCFGSLVWVDLPGGRMTASINSPRLTLRFRDLESESLVLTHLATLKDDLPDLPVST